MKGRCSRESWKQLWEAKGPSWKTGNVTVPDRRRIGHSTIHCMYRNATLSGGWAMGERAVGEEGVSKWGSCL